MDDDTLIQVEHVSKKFCRSLKRALWYGARDIGSELLGRADSRGRLRPSEFWAVDDVSFEVKRGECLGLIGPNGAGKSTLLKMLNGLIKPDVGKITVRGRVGALIELNTGFNPVLTGRENVYVNAAIHGISKREVDRNLEKIVEFAEIGDFIDAPFQTYSSGMKVRLGFAVASQLQPDILLVDEVLAVGDLAFRLKCMMAIRNMVDQGTSIIFVSHTTGYVTTVCEAAMWLENGRKRDLDSCDLVCSGYEQSLMRRKLGAAGHASIVFDERSGVRITDVRLVRRDGNSDLPLTTEEPVHIRITISCSTIPSSLVLTIGFRNSGHVLYYGERIDLARVLQCPGRYTAEVVLPPGTLLPGVHFFSCGLTRNKRWGSFIQNLPIAATIPVTGTTRLSEQSGLVNICRAVSVTSTELKHATDC